MILQRKGTLTLVFLHVLGFYTCFGQDRSVGINFLARYDMHAEYKTNFGGRSYDDTYKLSGSSFGINAFYRKALKQKKYFTISGGYYKLGIDKIKKKGATRKSRDLEYPDATKVLYHTKKYHYDNFSLGLALGKSFILAKKSDLVIAADLMAFSTFSQKYEMESSAPVAPYRAHNHKPIELTFNLNIGIAKRINDKYFYQPTLVLPVYQNLKGDRVFGEDCSMNVNKWFHGIGLSMSIGRFF
jgi:hypothetical protein